MNPLWRAMWRLQPAALITTAQAARLPGTTTAAVYTTVSGVDITTGPLTCGGTPVRSGPDGIIRFDGVDDYCSNTAVNRGPLGSIGTGDFTVMGFCRLSTAGFGGNFCVLFNYDRWTTGPNAEGIFVRASSSGLLNLWVGGTQIGTATTPDLRDDKWHFISATRSGTTCTGYVDLASVVTGTSSGNVDTFSNANRHLAIAIESASGYAFTPGYNDYYGMYNYVIPLSDQGNIMRLGFQQLSKVSG